MPIGNYDSSILCERHATRELEFSLSVTFAAKRGVKRPIGLKNLNSMVLEISHNNESFGIHGDAPGAVELTVTTSFPTKTEVKLAVAVKLDDAVVFSVGY